MDALKADTFRKFGRFSWPMLARGVLFSPAYRVMVTLRCCQAAQRCPPPVRWPLVAIARVMHALAGQWAGIELPWRTAVAPGLALTHGRGIVVNAGARIGSNVTLFHGVTLGQRDHIDGEGLRTTTYPVIEDDVWIGPHAIVVGGVTVGKGSRIAGGAYVFTNIPPCSVVLGNPGKIVKSDCMPDVCNRWESSRNDTGAVPDPRAAGLAAAKASVPTK